MANITGYTDPGVYISEEVVPGSASASTVPLTVCLIGIGNRTKRVVNEAVTRGLVSGEALAIAATPGAHTATLINISNRKTAQLEVLKDGVALDGVEFLPASMTGPALTTLDFTINNKIALSLDGKNAVTIAITSGADSTTISGGLITQALGSIGAIAAVTPTQIAEGINKALAGASSLGYGTAYGAVASVSSGSVVITSPLSTSASDIRTFTAFPAAQSRTAAVLGALSQASSIIQISDADYSATSVYEASYVSINTDQDTLANTDTQKVVRVGSYAGVTSFKENVDFTRSGDTLDWSVDAAAVFTSSIASPTYNVSVNDTIIVALDGKAAITIDLNGATGIPGYASPVDPAAATPAELANNINAALANAAAYGPRYATVVSVSATQLVLTSPTQGVGSIVEIGAPSSLSAVTAIFGLTSSQLPMSTYGTGGRPVAGAIYFASYEYTRPSTDYNKGKRFYTPESVYADVGYPSRTNQLAIAAGICFDNKAPSVILVQVDDANFPGSPTQNEIKAALDAAGNVSAATEICPLDVRLGVHVDMLDHVSAQNSPTQKNYRRGWLGMGSSAVIGDKDTPDSFIYRAVRTLQVPGDSPARGRLILVAPGQATRTIILENGSELDVTLDGSYVAAAIAARMTSFTSPADTLLRKTITGFKADTFPTYLKAERALLAGNGITVVTENAGKLVLTDPMSTEGGGGRSATFMDVSASVQKDSVTVAIDNTVDSNLVGIVPTDLEAFILTVKSYIAEVLVSLIAQGAIGPFKTDEGVTRDVDLSSDIQVFQDKTDPTKFYFRYFFNVRLPAKRFMGTYSVNNPFWARN